MEELPVIPKKEVTQGYQVTATPSPGSGVVRIAGIAGSRNDRPNDSILIQSGIEVLYIVCQVKQPGPVVIGVEYDGKIFPVKGSVTVLTLSSIPTDPVPVSIPPGKPGEIHTIRIFTGEMVGSELVWTGESIPFQIEIL